MEQIRQGDILLQKVEKVEGKKVGSGKRTVALGEATGHHHDIVGDVDFFETSSGQLLAQVNSSATMTHQEHAHHTIQKGVYAVIRQRELDLVEGIRSVTD